MSKNSNTQYGYTFNMLEKNIKFYFSANDEFSKEYVLKVLSRPEIEDVEINIHPPKHTSLNKETKQNTGSIKIPQGSMVTWKITTEKTDTLQFKTDPGNSILRTSSDNYFTIKRTINSNTNYQITLANANVSFLDTSFYDIKINLVNLNILRLINIFFNTMQFN